MYRSSHRFRSWFIGSLALAFVVPALAQAQSSRPTVSTGGVANVTPQSATLLGKVTPNGAQTIYSFQYGTSTLYGAVTPPGAAGVGTTAVNVVADLTALAPATTYTTGSSPTTATAPSGAPTACFAPVRSRSA